MKDNIKDYYIGLDIGTNSVGWAVTDTNYKVIKVKGEPLWGASLFDEAQTAAERRGFRVARRLAKRRRERIEYLQEQFASEIAKVDIAFFERLRESKFLFEDKRFTSSSYKTSKNILFSDKNFKDKDFYKKYPTIYHLRKDLIENKDDAFDIRFVYLALHNIFKHRGHFLYENVDLTDMSFSYVFNDFIDAYKNLGFDAHVFECFDVELLKETLSDKSISKNDKLLSIANISNIKKSSVDYKIIKLMLGFKEDISFFNDSLEEKVSISVSDDIEEQRESIIEKFNDNVLYLILKLKAIYDYILLEKIKGDYNFISFAKVDSYNKHKDDLLKLKKVLKDISVDDKTYRSIFTGKDSYESYTRHLGNESRKEGVRLTEAQGNAEDFFKKIKKALDGSDLDAAKEIILDIDNNTFLQKQSYLSNSVIPNQLHSAELKKILDNASTRFDFLNDKDDSNLTVKERLIQLFEFRVPYYVGPLNTKSQFAWVERNEFKKVYPWNFEKIIDTKASAEKFIERMLGTCSYTSDKVLPKESLLYSKFCVLNELNNLKVNGERIPVDVKQNIFNDLFMNLNTVSMKSLKRYLLDNGQIEEGDDISGIDGDFKSSLKSYIKFKKILGEDFYLDDKKLMLAEDIIRRATIFPDDRKMLLSYINERYGDYLSEEIIRKLSYLKFTAWGNLSYKLLSLKNSSHESLIDYMWNTNCNLMEVINFNEDFKGALSKLKAPAHNIDIDEYLDDCYVGPAARRAIRQADKIVDTVVKHLHNKPSRIFIEVTRENQKVKTRTQSRRESIKAWYKHIKYNKENINALLSDLEKFSDSDLRKERLYLYFTQLGKCMYSGEPINLNEIGTVEYDVDHIYPQSIFPRQDGFNNKVLVKSIYNKQKGDKLLSSDIQKNMKGFWDLLKSHQLITNEKYNRLNRKTEFTEQETSDFIDSQLVDTSQSVKVVADLFKAKFKDTKVVYSKAKLVSEFRTNQQILAKDVGLDDLYGDKMIEDPAFIKSRVINNLHHAKDAYLNIVVGNTYYTAFTKNYLPCIRKDSYQKSYLFNNLFKLDIKVGDDIAWLKGPDGSIKTVRAMMLKNNAFINRRPFERHGQILKQNCVKYKGSEPYKMDDRFSRKDEKNKFIYGGYYSAGISYFCIYKNLDTNKNKLLSIKIKDKEQYEANPVKYISNLEKSNVEIIRHKILINSKFLYKGLELIIKGKTGSNLCCSPSFSLCLDLKWVKYIKNLEKVCKLDSREYLNGAYEISKFDYLNQDYNIELYNILINKIKNTKLNCIMYNIAKELDLNYEKFLRLSLKVQCHILINIIKYMSNPQSIFKLNIGEFIISTILKTITFNEYIDCKIIDSSITGVFKN